MRKMLEELNNQLIEIKEKTRKRQKLLADLARTQQMLAQQRSRLHELDAELKKEGCDVEKLQGLSLTGLFHTILGSKDKQLEKERQEYLAAKLKHDECADSVSALDREQADLKEKVTALGDPESQYKAILDKKEKLIAETGEQNARRLGDLSEELADARSDVRELQEAIDAGKAVLTGVDAVIDSLRSAKNWGTWDMIGGGLISTAVKHSRIDRARASAHQVQQLLRSFQRELADVGATSDITIDIGSFATFADYFLDGLIVDWIVQSRIANSLTSATELRDKVQTTVAHLEQSLQQAQNKAARTEQTRQEMIEHA
jgi:hypothetical protein